VALLGCEVGLRCPDSLRCVPTLQGVGQQRLALKLVESLDVLAPLPFLLALDKSGGSLTAALAASMWHLKLVRAMAAALERSLAVDTYGTPSAHQDDYASLGTHGSSGSAQFVAGLASGTSVRRRGHPQQPPIAPHTAAATAPHHFLYSTDSAAAVDAVRKETQQQYFQR
jgi:hypothetical protein